MACEQWREKLDLYVDGELDPAQASALGAHLRGCADCAADVLGRVQLKRSVQMAPAPKKTSAKVPRNSATSFCEVVYTGVSRVKREERTIGF